MHNGEQHDGTPSVKITRRDVQDHLAPLRGIGFSTYDGCALLESSACFSNESPDIDGRNEHVLYDGPHSTVFDDSHSVQMLSLVSFSEMQKTGCMISSHRALHAMSVLLYVRQGSSCECTCG